MTGGLASFVRAFESLPADAPIADRFHATLEASDAFMAECDRIQAAHRSDGSASVWGRYLWRREVTGALEKVLAALAEHDETVLRCPVDHPRSPAEVVRGNCPSCGSSSRGPCWVKVGAATNLVNGIRAITRDGSDAPETPLSTPLPSGSIER